MTEEFLPALHRDYLAVAAVIQRNDDTFLPAHTRHEQVVERLDSQIRSLDEVRASSRGGGGGGGSSRGGGGSPADGGGGAGPGRPWTGGWPEEEEGADPACSAEAAELRARGMAAGKAARMQAGTGRISVASRVAGVQATAAKREEEAAAAAAGGDEGGADGGGGGV